MPELIALGEALIQFNALTKGPLRHVTLFEKHVAGAEANVAVCVSRLGRSSAFISRVGDDEFGRCIEAWLRAERVDTRWLKTEPGAPTGIYFVQRGYPIPSRSSMVYYRRGSAGSRLSPEDLEEEAFRDARMVHFTGITPALSATAREACLKAISLAQNNGLAVSIDTNIRPVLWPSLEEASEVLMPMVEKADILFTDPTDAEVLIGENEPEKILEVFRNLGIGTVVIKLGERGALASSGSEKARAEAINVSVEDPIGAGDALAGTFLACQLAGRSLFESLRRATLVGSLVTTVRGDQEMIPTLRDLEMIYRYYYP
ncbi:MAG: sugar kinase [Nitrososphaerota archaeon]|nr:sugar kinase [Nitrososphaerota archaeon]